MAEKKPKIKDTQPTEQIALPYGSIVQLLEKLNVTRSAAQKYLAGAAITPEAKARAKKVREYALNHNGQYVVR